MFFPSRLVPSAMFGMRLPGRLSECPQQLRTRGLYGWETTSMKSEPGTKLKREVWRWLHLLLLLQPINTNHNVNMIGDEFTETCQDYAKLGASF